MAAEDHAQTRITLVFHPRKHTHARDFTGPVAYFIRARGDTIRRFLSLRENAVW